MGKKRIFELARELGYSNRDLIDKLQKLGLEVKSHSSTVDADEVRTALMKAEQERKARTDERRVGSGVIRRRPKEGAEAVVRRPGHPDDTESSHEVGDTLRVDAAAFARETAHVEGRGPETADAHLRPRAPSTIRRAARVPDDRGVTESTIPVDAAVDEAPSASSIEVLGDGSVASDDAAPAAAVATAAIDAPTADVEADREGDASKKERREARIARPERKREEEFDDEEEKPMLEDLGISESDFAREPEEPQIANAMRVAPPAPSTAAAGKKVEEAAQSKIIRKIDPNVLKARLGTAKRPEPPKDWGRPIEVAASPVTEFEVRKDASGKRSELVDVRKEAAKGKSRGARQREEMTARDLLEHRRGQVYYPAPNRKRIKGGKKVGRRTDLAQTGPRKPIEIGDTITVANLSQQLSVKATEVISWLMRQGMMASMNQPLDHEMAAAVCEQFGFEVESTQFQEAEHLSGQSVAEAKAAPDVNATPRAPVVTVMGHVDHGKTSLLDKIRNANVAAGEAGGITQRIAGYQVGTAKGPVTFLDTPGHAAFTQMRARGANVTDIVILVVAADDGVMPQTIEALQHARSANVPIIVALNKIDKPDANPDRVLQQLADNQLLVEEWGGETLCRRISAKTGEGVDALLELIALQAEILELRARPDAPAAGIVVESHVHRGRGPVATVLVREGTLRQGEIIVVGERIGKVRAMMTDGGRTVSEAGPSTPVEILGLDGVATPGEELRVADSLNGAKELASHRRDRRRAQDLSGQATVSLQDLFARIKAGEQKELKIIVKGDAQGTVEAVRDALVALSTEKVRVAVIGASVGAVVESDVEFATASNAIIVGFGVRPDTKALKTARAANVDIRTYDIIYEAVDEVRKAMEGLLSPIAKERYLGRAEVRQTFDVPKVGTIAGCAVVDGVVSRKANIRLLRDSKAIFDGKLASLKRFKDDAREVKEGFECGMGIEKWNDIRVGDIIEAYEIVQVQASLDGALQPSSGAVARV